MCYWESRKWEVVAVTRMITNPDRSMVRTSDFKSENRGSIPRQGAFYLGENYFLITSKIYHNF